MAPHATIDRATLAETLHYGVPINRPAPAPGLPFDVEVLEAARARREAGIRDKSAAIEEGAALWREVCARTVERASHPILLPLSAGLDSRAVLAGVRACGARVHTVTYGVPGAFDYELAPRIAACAGASNTRMNLENMAITRERLLEIAARAARPSSVLDMFFNAQLAARHGTDYSYVSGFAGDALAGGHLKAADGFWWNEATAAFAQWHRASRTVTLTEPDMDPIAALPSEPFVDPELLPSIQQLDYAVRQQRLVRPIVCPAGVEVLTPFLDPAWCGFMLGLPDAPREDRAFFADLFRRSFPELFSLPSTASGGLPLDAGEAAIRRYRRRLRRRRRMRARLRRLFPKINVPPADRRWQYLDFRTLLRQDSPLAALFADSMARLDRRAAVPWIDARGLLEAHRAYQADHFKALNALFNLELLLEARPELFARAPDSQDAVSR